MSLRRATLTAGCVCGYCQCPLYSSDRAWVDPQGRCYCTPGCGLELARREVATGAPTTQKGTWPALQRPRKNPLEPRWDGVDEQSGMRWKNYDHGVVLYHVPKDGEYWVEQDMGRGSGFFKTLQEAQDWVVTKSRIAGTAAARKNPMASEKRRRLEAAGWRVGTVDEFLDDVFGPENDAPRRPRR